jgi:hypothetical protein
MTHIRIGEDAAGLPASLTCLLTIDHELAGLRAYVEHDIVHLVESVKLAWNHIEEHRIASWPVEELSVREMRAVADRWMAEQKGKVA